MDSVNEQINRIDSYLKKELGDSKLYELIRARIESLNIKVLDGASFAKLYKDLTQSNDFPSGFYRRSDETVYIYRLKDNTTIIHEIIHALSDNKEDKLGLNQYSNGIGRMFNEMATCYITSKIIGSGNGGFYSKDYHSAFKMFLSTMKMEDNELLQLFFQSENWITDELKTRFNKNNPEALEELITMYDKRTTHEFDKNRIIELLEESSHVNGTENDERYVENMIQYCDSFDIKPPDRIKPRITIKNISEISSTGLDSWISIDT